MVDTDDTRRTTYDGRRTTPRVWHKLPTGELKKFTGVTHVKYENSCLIQLQLLGRNNFETILTCDPDLLTLTPSDG